MASDRGLYWPFDYNGKGSPVANSVSAKFKLVKLQQLLEY